MELKTKKKKNVPIKHQKLTHTEISRGDSFLCGRHFWSLSLPACDLLQLGYLFVCERFVGLGSVYTSDFEKSPREVSQLEDETGREGSL